MVQIAPFRALRYNPHEISFISRVIAPPFDVIDAEAAQELRESDPQNAIRLVLGDPGDFDRAEEDYQAAAATLKAWLLQKVLVQEEEPVTYVCEQQFDTDSETCRRHGIICTMLLEEFGRGGVLPHEDTTSGPKADRLRLMEACRANLSQVFGVFSDSEGRADALIREMAFGMPLHEFRTPDSVVYKVWRVGLDDRLRALARAMEDQSLFIADGHHRYETALRYRELHRSTSGPPGSAPEDFISMFCVSVDSPGLRVRPTHRLVTYPDGFEDEDMAEALRDFCEVTEKQIDTPEALEGACARLGSRQVCCFVGRGRLYVLDLREDRLKEVFPERGEQWRKMPVVQLHHGLLGPALGIPPDAGGNHERLAFRQKAQQIYWLVEGGRYDAGFLLPPTEPRAVQAVAEAGERLPPKSTYFYPKIPSGLAFYSFERCEEPPPLITR